MSVAGTANSTAGLGIELPPPFEGAPSTTSATGATDGKEPRRGWSAEYDEIAAEYEEPWEETQAEDDEEWDDEGEEWDEQELAEVDELGPQVEGQRRRTRAEGVPAAPQVPPIPPAATVPPAGLPSQLAPVVFQAQTNAPVPEVKGTPEVLAAVQQFDTGLGIAQNFLLNLSAAPVASFPPLAPVDWIPPQNPTAGSADLQVIAAEAARRDFSAAALKALQATRQLQGAYVRLGIARYRHIRIQDATRQQATDRRAVLRANAELQRARRQAQAQRAAHGVSNPGAPRAGHTPVALFL
jgi:hypothetical protein